MAPPGRKSARMSRGAGEKGNTMVAAPQWRGPMAAARFIGLGLAVHAILAWSVVDIHFQSPIVTGMDPVPPEMPPLAERVILIVADGLRADSFFERDENGASRAPFIHSMAAGGGRWGVSLARAPTESRPGHVSIIGGLYEDPSALFKGWQANPVHFDTVVNRSAAAWGYGSPDVVPIFTGGLPHASGESYPPEWEDFGGGPHASNLTHLDSWVFGKAHALIDEAVAVGPEGGARSHAARLWGREGPAIMFLHLLGLDSQAHAAGTPHSPGYHGNIRAVDQMVAELYARVESTFPSGTTAYVFTADHGMTNMASHGDGSPDAVRTPLVAWGAGVSPPSAGAAGGSTALAAVAAAPRRRRPAAAAAGGPPPGAPSEWQQLPHSDGGVYYYNVYNGSSTRIRPPAPQSAAAPSGGWRAVEDPRSPVYYYDESTGRTQWEMPLELAKAEAPDWKGLQDPAGGTYYYHAPTGRSQREVPPALSAVAAAASWQVVTHVSGAQYYYNLYTGASQTDPPGELSATWQARTDPTGAVYYYSVVTGASQWDPPPVPPPPPDPPASASEDDYEPAYGEGAGYDDEAAAADEASCAPWFPTPEGWNLQSRRCDTEQADLAPLLASLLGTPIPTSSVGRLPLGYLRLPGRARAVAARAHAAHLLALFRHREAAAAERRWAFSRYAPLEGAAGLLDLAMEQSDQGHHEVSVEESRNVAEECLLGLDYLNTYDWLLLALAAVAGYAAWAAFVCLELARAGADASGKAQAVPRGVDGDGGGAWGFAGLREGLAEGRPRAVATALGAAASLALALQRARPTYHLYALLPLALGGEVAAGRAELAHAARGWRAAWGGPVAVAGALASGAACLAAVVAAFYDRSVLAPLLALLAAAAFLHLSRSRAAPPLEAALIFAGVGALAAAAALPAEHGEDPRFVAAACVASVALALLARALEGGEPGGGGDAGLDRFGEERGEFEVGTGARGVAERVLAATWGELRAAQIACCVLAAGLAALAPALRARGAGLPAWLQALNWALAIASPVLPLLSPPRYIPRLVSAFLGAVPPYALLSISHEALALPALAAALLALLAFEWRARNLGPGPGAALFARTFPSAAADGAGDDDDEWSDDDGGAGRGAGGEGAEQELRPRAGDGRVAVAAVVLMYAAFFAPGNSASVASFKIASVYRFTTRFDPVAMGLLLFAKILAPLGLVAVAFAASLRLLRVHRRAACLAGLLASDAMGLAFFFAVRGTGSWQEVGESISHYGMAQMQVAFVLLLLWVAQPYTRDLPPGGDSD